MEEQVISFETAKLAKEKGFKHKTNKGYSNTNTSIPRLLDCQYYYDFNSYTTENRGGWAEGYGDLYAAPIQSLVQKWIREKHEIHIEIYSNASGWGYILTKINGTTIKEIEDDIFFNSYEEALEIGLELSLKRIKSP